MLTREGGGETTTTTTHTHTHTEEQLSIKPYKIPSFKLNH